VQVVRRAGIGYGAMLTRTTKAYEKGLSVLLDLHIFVIFLVYTHHMTIQKGIYMVYTHDIPKLYLAFDHLCHIPGLYLEKTLWVCFVPVTYPAGHVIYQTYVWYVWYMTWPAGYVTGTEQTHKVFLRYSPGI
jgi:hypothetical protein